MDAAHAHNRGRIAGAIAALAEKQRWTPDDLEAFGDTEWNWIARAAGARHFPIHTDTRRLAITLLADRLALREA